MKRCPICEADVPEEVIHCECGYIFAYFEKRATKSTPVREVLTAVPDRTLKRDRVLFAIVAIYLTITFIRRLFPTTEFPRKSEIILRVVIELALAVGLIGLGRRILKAIPRGTPGRGKWLFLFVAGLVSLFGIFAIQLTGGQRVEWQPRSKVTAPALPADLKAMVSRIEGLVESYQKADAELRATRWAQTSATGDPKQLAKLPREDLREYLVKERALLNAIDRMREYLAEPRLADDFNRIWSYAESQGLTAGRERPDFDPRPWRLLREIYGPASELNTIVEENWEEWRLLKSPVPEAERKPWQKEIVRLSAQVESARKELKQLLDAPGSAATPQATPGI
jgi:hypothetical protein